MTTEMAAAKEAEAARPQIQELTNFLSEYTAKMLSIGTYTARIERCVRRIADAYDYEASLMIFVRHFIISVMDPADNSIRRTYVKTGAAARISFDLISELSALSWEIYDEKIPLARARAAFAEILASQKKSFAKTLVLLSVANAAFCELFGGDGGAMALVFAATAFGICARYLLSKLKISLKIQYIAVSFAVSFIVSLGARYGLSATPDVAVGSSILFLIPGVWLINSVFDILNENMLVGISRGLNTGLLIICIAIGLFLTLSISNLGLVNV
ncbi:threonine/serine exporter family protein [uncultured Campylobacter sp.]|uniref:threonine/serine exporter family protein n=1 Tax=uncultured Campylobacter sp. TaxID=218934 RepID=UPI0025EFE9D6|nr:threonine/serine exporter family protein [uncultured Campylobacter sp.]